MRKHFLIGLMIVLASCRTGIDLGRPVSVAGNAHQRPHSITLPLIKVYETELSNSSGTSVPLVFDGQLYIPTLLSGIDIIATENGVESGWITHSGAMIGTPAISGASIYVPIAGGPVCMIRVSMPDGSIVHEFKGEPVESAVLTSGPHIVTSGVMGTVSCYDKTDSLLWTRKLLKPSYGSPVANGRVLYLSSSSGDVYALGLHDGSIVWRVPTGSAIHSSPTVSNGTVIVANREGRVLCISASDGCMLWRQDIGCPVYSSPSSDGTMAFISGTDGTLRALNMKDGRLEWQHTMKGILSGSPLIADKKLVVTSMAGAVEVLDNSSGVVLWSDSVEGRIRTAPVFADSTLCIITDDGTVFGFRSSK